MKNIWFVLSLFLVIVFQSSCVDEEDIFIDDEVEVEVVQEPTAIPSVTSIIFSYNVHDNESGITTSWLIDNVGKVRKMEHSPILDYHESELSFYDLNKLKSESIETTTLVNRQDLIDNLRKLKDIAPSVAYDNTSESNKITSIYGYFFTRIVNSNGGGSTCSCSDNRPPSHQSDYFEYRLLQQKVGDDIAVSESDDIIAWINSLNLEDL